MPSKTLPSHGESNGTPRSGSRPRKKNGERGDSVNAASVAKANRVGSARGDEPADRVDAGSAGTMRNALGAPSLATEIERAGSGR